MTQVTARRRPDDAGPNAVRTVETCGARFALLEDDVVAVLTLMDDGDSALDRDAVLDLVSDMLLSVVSLGEQLFPMRASAENMVVVLRHDDEVFGLLVEAVGNRDVVAAIGETVRLAEVTDVPVLDRDRLALCTLEPATLARH